MINKIHIEIPHHYQIITTFTDSDSRSTLLLYIHVCHGCITFLDLNLLYECYKKVDQTQFNVIVYWYL